MKRLITLLSAVLLAFPLLAFAQFTTVQGGTGTSSPSGILYGDSTLHLKTVKIGSNLTFSGGTLSASGGGAVYLATTSPWTNLNLVQVSDNGHVTSIATSSLNLTTSSFASANISQWTNDSAYITASALTPYFSLATWYATTSAPQLNSGSATKLATGRTLAITGDLAWTSPSFDGSGNVTAAGTLATVNSNVGSFTNANITVNGKGLVTAASNGSAGSASSTLLSDNNTFGGTDNFTGTFKIGGTQLSLPVSIANGGTATTSVTTYPWASSWAAWDANKNLSANNFLAGYTAAVPATPTTTLTSASSYNIYVASSSPTVYVLPSVTTIPLGTTYRIESTQSDVVIKDSTGATVWDDNPDSVLGYPVTLTSLSTSVQEWDPQPLNVQANTGKVGFFSNSLILAGTDGTTMTFPSTNATIARTDAAQTFTGLQSFSNATSTLFTSTTAWLTNASTTNLTASSFADSALTSGDCVQASTGGLLTSASGACGSSSGAAYPFGGTGNSTSTLTQFNNGLTAYATSTIGAGGQGTGLTISGGATTTGATTLQGNETINAAISGATSTIQIGQAGNSGCVTSEDTASSSVSYEYTLNGILYVTTSSCQ